MVKKWWVSLMLVVTVAGTAWAVDETFVTISTQSGTQDTSKQAPILGESEGYIQALERTQGALQSDRTVSLSGVSLDFYRVHGPSAVGFEVKLQRYEKQYLFANGANVSLSVQQFLYGVNAYHRGGWWFPFIGIGSGSVYGKVSESLELDGTAYSATTFGQVANPYFFQYGVRFPFGSFGLLLVRQHLSATMQVETEKTPLELGGEATLFGLSLIF